MKTKTLFWLIAVWSLLSVSCDKNTTVVNNSESSEELPELEAVDDVCEKMDDLDFMTFCYENFDVNKDTKVSMAEANAVTTIECNDAASFAGLEYFTNLENFTSTSARKVDFRYNKKLKVINCRNCRFLTDVALPVNLTTIGRSSFYGCSSLPSIEFPEGLRHIESFAFYGCSSLTLVDASQCKTLETVASDSFAECPIQEFLLGTSTPPRGDWIFSDLSDAVLKVPAESVDAYKANSEWGFCFGYNVVPLD